MRLTGKRMVSIFGLTIWLVGPQLVYAQVGGGQQDAASIVNGMSSDMLAKVQSLAQILEQEIKDGKVTNDDIQRGLLSGQLREKLQQLNPEAGLLLSELGEASKEGKGLSQDNLLPLLGGLGHSSH